MTPVVAGLKRLMHMNRCANSCEIKSAEKVKATQAPSDQTDSHVAVANHDVSEENPIEDECLMHAA